jgi:hypothetical protein
MNAKDEAWRAFSDKVANKGDAMNLCQRLWLVYVWLFGRAVVTPDDERLGQVRDD